jgi:hypothetical protein
MRARTLPTVVLFLSESDHSPSYSENAVGCCGCHFLVIGSERHESSVSLEPRSSLSIQPLEGSRSRVRRTRGAMGIQSISA